MKPFDRMAFAAAQPCRFGCVYCFARFDRFGLEHPLPRFSDDDLREDRIIYPTCDGEFFSDHRAMANLERLVDSARSSVLVSISVKSRIGKTHTHFLRRLNERLNGDRRGLVKCSVSLSAKQHLNAYDPKAPDYSHRLDVLKRLAEENIPTSVNPRPILPDVPTTEYQEIISDTAPYTSVYLVGGLYIDPKTEFGRNIKAKYSSFITLRSVDWLPNRPQWEYCEVPLQMAVVRKPTTENARQLFDTDLLVMKYLSSRSSISGINELTRPRLRPTRHVASKKLDSSATRILCESAKVVVTAKPFILAAHSEPAVVIARLEGQLSELIDQIERLQDKLAGLSRQLMEKPVMSSQSFTFNGPVTGNVTIDSSNTIHQGLDSGSVRARVAELTKLAAGLDRQRATEVLAALGKVDLNATELSPRVLREVGHTIRNICEGATGSLAAAGILSILGQLGLL
jgi:hypothetical protein